MADRRRERKWETEDKGAGRERDGEVLGTMTAPKMARMSLATEDEDERRRTGGKNEDQEMEDASEAKDGVDVDFLSHAPDFVIEGICKFLDFAFKLNLMLTCKKLASRRLLFLPLSPLHETTLRQQRVYNVQQWKELKNHFRPLHIRQREMFRGTPTKLYLRRPVAKVKLSPHNDMFAVVYGTNGGTRNGGIDLYRYNTGSHSDLRRGCHLLWSSVEPVHENVEVYFSHGSSNRILIVCARLGAQLLHVLKNDVIRRRFDLAPLPQGVKFIENGPFVKTLNSSFLWISDFSRFCMRRSVFDGGNVGRYQVTINNFGGSGKDARDYSVLRVDTDVVPLDDTTNGQVMTDAYIFPVPNFTLSGENVVGHVPQDEAKTGRGGVPIWHGNKKATFQLASVRSVGNANTDILKWEVRMMDGTRICLNVPYHKEVAGGANLVTGLKMEQNMLIVVMSYAHVNIVNLATRQLVYMSKEPFPAAIRDFNLNFVFFVEPFCCHGSEGRQLPQTSRLEKMCLVYEPDESDFSGRIDVCGQHGVHSCCCSLERRDCAKRQDTLTPSSWAAMDVLQTRTIEYRRYNNKHWKEEYILRSERILGFWTSAHMTASVDSENRVILTPWVSHRLWKGDHTNAQIQDGVHHRPENIGIMDMMSYYPRIL